MVVNGEFHIGEIINRNWSIEVHYISTDSVLGNLAPRKTLIQKSFLLFTLCKHLIVNRAC